MNNLENTPENIYLTSEEFNVELNFEACDWGKIDWEPVETRTNDIEYIRKDLCGDSEKMKHALEKFIDTAPLIYSALERLDQSDVKYHAQGLIGSLSLLCKLTIQTQDSNGKY